MKKVEGVSKISDVEVATRPLGSTELTLCKSLAGGTGITVIALLFSKYHEKSAIQNALRHLQSKHPLLRSRLRYQRATKTYSFVTSPEPFINVKEFDAESTSGILQPESPDTPIVQIVEHGLNEDMWSKFHSQPNKDLDMFFATSYEVGNKMRILVLQILTVICDRTAGATLLKEFLERLSSQDNIGALEVESLNNVVSSAIEDLIPKRTAKSVWSTGKTLLGHTVMALGLTNLSFKDTKLMPRSSRVIRLQLDQLQTQNLLAGCESRKIKLFGALTAAAMMAAHSLNVNRNDNFGVITVFDCRSDLNPPLSRNDFGFYYSGLITSHALKACSGSTETLWDLASKSYESFCKTKKTNNHFNDLVIMNKMVWKAIENPVVTPSSAQRTSFLSLFDEPAIYMDSQSELYKTVGLEDIVACASAHGIGPSIAVYDTIQDGMLNLTCLYPSPLHSKEQMVEIVDKMKNILVDAGSQSH